MGRTALFLVLGLGMAMGFIGLQMYRADEAAIQTQYAYLKYMNARNLARASVHTALRAFDKNVTPEVLVKTRFNNGTFQIDSLAPSADFDTLQMITRGTYAESTYVMRLKLHRSTRPFPTVGAAIGIRAAPISFSLNGHASVDGRAYDTTGTHLIGSGDKPGITTMRIADSATVATEGGANISGNPPVKTDTTVADPSDYLDIYKNSADFFYNTAGTYSGQTWGSSSNPVIVYCNAGDDTSFAVKFTGGVTGYGILVVRGNVQFNGNLNFYGLVIVDGFNTTVSFGAAGTPGVVGGLIVAGKAGASVTLKGTGSNGKVVYSPDALAKAKNIGKLRYYTILDWYE
ncbi:MAG TPA: hypothetical protein DEP53_01690 [Bacteroidetes bacterium]|nr:hypothetical protein [Bacteroidota bacterium]